jgi:hypothetical protein
MRIVSACVLAIVNASCATSGAGRTANASPDPPLRTEVAVTGLRADEQDALEKQVCALSGVSRCERQKRGREVVFAFDYAGSLTDLQRRIKAIPSPGLEAEEVKASLRFRGFDNKAPTITVIAPKTDRVLVETKVEVVVEVPDKDVESVQIGDARARAERGGIYTAKIELKEGDNDVVVVAVDEAGNEAEARLKLTVDTTPPEVDATVKVVVEGKVERGSTVFVDGVQVPVDVFGGWRIELPVKRGQKSVEVVAIDKNGNKTTETRSIGLE